MAKTPTKESPPIEVAVAFHFVRMSNGASGAYLVGPQDDPKLEYRKLDAQQQMTFIAANKLLREYFEDAADERRTKTRLNRALEQPGVELRLLATEPGTGRETAGQPTDRPKIIPRKAQKREGATGGEGVPGES